MISAAEDIVIHSSGRRLYALGAFASFCFVGGIFQLLPLLEAQELKSFWGWTFILMCVLFAVWAICAFWIGLRQHEIAYRLTEEGVYFGNQSDPAFQWKEIQGARLVRGKRRSYVAIILKDGAKFNRAGILPDLIATFLGKPTDSGVVVSNVDTRIDFSTLLDLIRPFLRTYGLSELTES
ncbi:MAG: hypothetical protein ACPGO7_01210 [Alphaproteobacteria bacterium]